MSDKIKVICSIEKIRFYKNEWGIAEISIDKIKDNDGCTPLHNLAKTNILSIAICAAAPFIPFHYISCRVSASLVEY